MFTLESKDFPSLPAINQSLSLEEAEDHKIYIDVPADYLTKIKDKLGDVDVVTLLNSAMINEAKQEIAKQITKAAFKGQNFEDISLEDLAEVFRNSRAKYAICSVRTGANIQEREEYKSKPLQNSFASNPGVTYEIGKWHDIQIWVDPFLSWDDKRIALIEEDFLNFRIKTEGEPKESSNIPAKIIATASIVNTPPVVHQYNITDLQ